jgi:hypothetical protein
MNVHQTEQTMQRLRYLAMYDQSPLTRMFRELDAHLSAGGNPPEAWREGPDAPLPDPGFSFYNLNEQGEVYDRHDSMSPALDTLAEFPNDIVAIVTTGSPQDALLSSQEAQR